MTIIETQKAIGSVSTVGALVRGGAVAARLVHTQKVDGSSPSPATNPRPKFAVRVVTFSDGSTAETNRSTRSFGFGWCAAGTLRSGKAWRITGFSISADRAELRMAETIRHIPRQGGKITFREVQPVPAERSVA